MILKFTLYDRPGNHGETRSLFNRSFDGACIVHFNRAFQAYPQSLQLTTQVLRRGRASSRQNELFEGSFLGRQHVSLPKFASRRRHNDKPICPDPLDADVPGPQMFVAFRYDRKIKGIFFNQTPDGMCRMDGDQQFNIRESFPKRRQNFWKQVDPNNP